MLPRENLATMDSGEHSSCSLGLDFEENVYNVQGVKCGPSAIGGGGGICLTPPTPLATGLHTAHAFEACFVQWQPHFLSSNGIR